MRINLSRSKGMHKIHSSESKEAIKPFYLLFIVHFDTFRISFCCHYYGVKSG
jgi:hypothetical protein